MRARVRREGGDTRGVAAEASSLLELMERWLADPSADLDRLDRVAGSYERALSREAEQNHLAAGQAASTITSRTSTIPPRPPYSVAADSFDLCGALYAAFKAGQEPAAALVGYLGETAIL